MKERMMKQYEEMIGVSLSWRNLLAGSAMVAVLIMLMAFAEWLENMF